MERERAENSQNNTEEGKQNWNTHKLSHFKTYN